MAAEGKQQFAWDLQSCLLCMLANKDIPKGKKKTTPADFNPTIKKRKGKKKRIEITGVIGGMMPAHLVAKFAELSAVKAAAIASGDWTEFNRLTAEFRQQ